LRTVFGDGSAFGAIALKGLTIGLTIGAVFKSTGSFGLVSLLGLTGTISFGTDLIGATGIGIIEVGAAFSVFLASSLDSVVGLGTRVLGVAITFRSGFVVVAGSTESTGAGGT